MSTTLIEDILARDIIEKQHYISIIAALLNNLDKLSYFEKSNLSVAIRKVLDDHCVKYGVKNE